MTAERMVEFHEPDPGKPHQPGWGTCAKCGLIVRLVRGEWMSFPPPGFGRRGGIGYRTCPQ